MSSNKRRAYYYSFLIVLFGLGTAVGFQNCAEQMPPSAQSNQPSNGGEEPPPCSNGYTLDRYGACVALATACYYNGSYIGNGSTLTMYESATVTAPATCNSQIRTCSYGVLTGTFTNPTCQVLPGTAAANCVHAGITVAHGASADFYSTSSVAAGATCQKESRTCTNGVLSGSFAYATCTSASGDCSFNGDTILNHASKTYYATATVPAGSTCQSQSRTCTNGILSGTYAEKTCSVLPPTGGTASCTFDGAPLAHGQSVTAYQSTEGATLAMCTAMQGTQSCTNGVLQSTLLVSRACAKAASSVTLMDGSGTSLTWVNAIANLDGIFNDSSAGISISSGAWQACQHANYAGTCRTYGVGENYDLADLFYNISSLRPANQNTQAPVIAGSGSGCGDFNCIWLTGNNFSDDSVIEVYRVSDGSLLGQYFNISSQSSFSFSQPGGGGYVDVATLALRSAAEKSEFAAAGLNVRVRNITQNTISPIRLVKASDH